MLTINSANGRVLRASAFEDVDSSLIPTRVKSLTIKLLLLQLPYLTISIKVWTTSWQVRLFTVIRRHLTEVPLPLVLRGDAMQLPWPHATQEANAEVG